MHARHIVNLSLAQFQADDAVVALERNLESRQNRMEEIRTQFSQTDKQFATLIHKRKLVSEKFDRSVSKDPADSFLSSLHAGDIVDGFKHLGVCVVVSKDHPRHEPHLRIIDTNGRVHTVEQQHIDPRAQCIGHIELPMPIAPRTKHFRISTSIALNKELKKIARSSEKGSPPPQRSNKDVQRNELLDEYIHSEKEVKRLTRRVQSRGQSLARQFERILGLLEEMEYVDGWALTEKGDVLSHINAEADLAISHHVTHQLLQHLSVAELAAYLSCFVHETRGDNDARSTRFPTKSLGGLAKECERFIAALNDLERDAGIKESRSLDYGMMDPAYQWARGKSLEDILDNRDIAGGDFVRMMKSVIDLVRQIETATDDPLLQELCKETVAACFRDVIELSS
jgi:ATP-dependent RNA helicase HelY